MAKDKELKMDKEMILAHCGKPLTWEEKNGTV